jgi:carbon-monoxide dehydrogenase large subunit
VGWTAHRSEEFASAAHGRGADIRGTLQIEPSGTIERLEAELDFDLGAWLPFSAVVPLRNAARILPGPYALPHTRVRGQGRLTPRAPVNIYRGAGRPEAALLMETLIEAAARRLGRDPIELRRAHLVKPGQMPWQTSSGERLDSGDYPALLDLACRLFDYEKERQTQKQRRARGERVGIGTAFYVEPCGQGWEWARITQHPEGRYTLASGSPAQGQGHQTTWARIAADVLNCAPDSIDVFLGDTDACPSGIGTLASRSTAIGGSAIVEACRALMRRRDAGEALPLTAEHRFESVESWSAGCVIARARVCPETGAPTVEKIAWSDDAGRIIDPVLARGQLLGGAAQGLGQALLEAIHYDGDQQLLTGSFMDYALPRAGDLPEILIESMCSPSPNNPLGAKGVGEAGCIGIPAAIMNAVRDALADLGEVDLEFPLRAEQIWRVLQSCSPETQ